MRTRRILSRAALATALCLSATTLATLGQVARAGTGAVTAQVSTVDACPPAKAPMAQCFAKVRVASGAQVAPQAAAPTGFGPADLRSAYALPGTGGAGHTVAIVDAFNDPSVEADLATYRSTFGLPACTAASGCLRVVNQAGAASPLPTDDAGWALEISLDVDMVSATCPDCHILLVEATSNSIDDLGAAVDTAARLGADAISNSYGSQEFAAEQQFEAHYNHPGHAVVASAGDSGYGAAYPASSAFVTAVGGTTLRRAGTGWTESVWSGTGSGCSAYIAKPSWQTDAHCPMRMEADIAAVADPATGVAVYDTFSQSGWLTVGGTSASAPIIAALYAMTGATAGVTGGETPWLRHTASNVRDVTTGTNVPGVSATTCGGDYLCTGTAGYDGPTGWGTPQGLGSLTSAAG
jgi:subtilase family serine protease